MISSVPGVGRCPGELGRPAATSSCGIATPPGSDGRRDWLLSSRTGPPSEARLVGPCSLLAGMNPQADAGGAEDGRRQVLVLLRVVAAGGTGRAGAARQRRPGTPKLVSCAVSSSKISSRRRTAQITGRARRSRSIMVTSRMSASTSSALAASISPLAASSASCSAASARTTEAKLSADWMPGSPPCAPGPAGPARWQAAPGYRQSSRTRRASRGRPRRPTSPAGCSLSTLPSQVDRLVRTSMPESRLEPEPEPAPEPEPEPKLAPEPEPEPELAPEPEPAGGVGQSGTVEPPPTSSGAVSGTGLRSATCTTYGSGFLVVARRVRAHEINGHLHAERPRRIRLAERDHADVVREHQRAGDRGALDVRRVQAPWLPRRGRSGPPTR